MPRPRHEIRPHDWKLSIPRDLAAEVDMLLWDPVMQKPRYGGRSQLVANLLRRWIEEQRGSSDPQLAVAHAEGSSTP